MQSCPSLEFVPPPQIFVHQLIQPIPIAAHRNSSVDTQLTRSTITDRKLLNITKHNTHFRYFTSSLRTACGRNYLPPGKVWVAHQFGCQFCKNNRQHRMPHTPPKHYSPLVAHFCRHSEDIFQFTNSQSYSHLTCSLFLNFSARRSLMSLSNFRFRSSKSSILFFCSLTAMTSWNNIFQCNQAVPHIDT